MVPSNSKKVILFVVEGISDKNALNPIIAELLQSERVYFEVVHGDVTSDYKRYTATNIKQKLTEIVNGYLNKSNFHVDDLLEIIWITDLDGAYIKEDNIVYTDIDKVEYYENEIKTRHTSEIHMRNIVKSGILNNLVRSNDLEVRGKLIKFQIYYMSCNLDHVLYNDRNLDPLQKNIKAIEFADSYAGIEERFIEFLDGFLLSDDYETSWNKVKFQNNSLNRYTNLSIYLKAILERN